MSILASFFHYFNRVATDPRNVGFINKDFSGKGRFNKGSILTGEDASSIDGFRLSKDVAELLTFGLFRREPVNGSGC